MKVLQTVNLVLPVTALGLLELLPHHRLVLAYKLFNVQIKSKAQYSSFVRESLHLSMVKLVSPFCLSGRTGVVHSRANRLKRSFTQFLV